MATKVQMPKLSDTMEEGVILKWLKNEGDKVKQGETLVEIESDKADMEVEAYDSGVLKKILVPAGGKAPIGALIAVIAEADENIDSLLSESSDSSAAEKPKKVSEPKVEQSEVVQQTPRVEKQQAPAPPPAVPAPRDGRVKASPLARRLASEHRINLSGVPGSGPQGRVIKRDIEGVLSGSSSVGGSRLAAHIVPGTTEEIALSPIRKTIAKRMTESKQQAPHFYVTVAINMEPAMAFREQINSATDLKITFTDIILKASAAALMRHPNVNGSYLGSSMRVHNFVHIGVAVALEDGLVTPVVRNCEQKRIDQINAELRDLVDRARNRKLKPEEYQGSTFTVSNLGMFDVEDFVAIINPPEAAILAVGSIKEEPVVRNGQMVIGHRMRVTLSSDHRVIDGAVAARFLQDFKKFMENPAALTL